MNSDLLNTSKFLDKNCDVANAFWELDVLDIILDIGVNHGGLGCLDIQILGWGRGVGSQGVVDRSLTSRETLLYLIMYRKYVQK